MVRRGTTHITIVVTSESENGFPNWRARCECGWTSVSHHCEKCAVIEGTWHNLCAARTPGVPR